MRAKFGLFALMTGGLLLAAVAPGHAQTSTTGAIKGVITDQATGDPVIGATVVATGPALQGTQAEITDASGQYRISNLPPGTYLLTVYYADAEFARPNALVRLGKVAQVNIAIDTEAGKGEVIQIEGRAPVIDQGSTKTGRTITPDYTQNVPTGRTFGAVLGSAAGSQADTYGVSFGGSTSTENVYIVEGLNTTDPAYGLQSTNLPNEFVKETEVISGGYNAEYGRSTGGVVNVVTKSGSNELHGSVFGTVTPGSLSAIEVATPREGSAIDDVEELAYKWDVGAELGGPIIKDKLWFHVGLSPSFHDYDVHRIISRRVDRNNDGVPDVDANGFTVLEEVARKTLERSGRTTFFTSKLTGAISPDHQGSVSFLGNPGTRTSWRTVVGVERAGLRDIESGAYDVSGKWTSKFDDNKFQIDAVAGLHRNFNRQIPTAEGNTKGIRYDITKRLGEFQDYESVPLECIDDDDGNPDDPTPGFTNCPVKYYNVGGLAFREVEETDRFSALLSATRRVKAAGHHTLKAGFDAEYQIYDHLSHFPGGELFLRKRYGNPILGDTWRVDRYYRVDPMGPEMCGDTPCSWSQEGFESTTRTRNLGAYFQDSWAILPNLTVNAGVRWEQQTLFVGDEVKDQLEDDVAFEISDMVAPRLGVIYDPTQEGRAKIFSHWGRFYESIPMDINARGFGGEIGNRNYYPLADPADDNSGACTVIPNETTMCDPADARIRQVFGGGEEAVEPGIKGQYLDEIVVGGEYELLNDFKVGGSYIRRTLGRVIEDISLNNGGTYFIANPGEGDEELIAELRATGDPDDAFLADMIEASIEYDTPTRTYDALQLTAEKRFSASLMLQASYTLSRLEGNFPGLFSPETGQLDPNLTSMYDLPELMANRTGPLAADRTHLFKLDGYYSRDVKNIGHFVFGSSVRASSGIPHNYLGAHLLYGPEESYILPRGTATRSPFNTRFDVHVAYGRKLSNDMELQAFMDVFNVFNQQPEIDVDEAYTDDVVDPIVGGDESDLAHLKAVGSNELAERNPNFGNPNSRQAPLSMQFGLRLTF